MHTEPILENRQQSAFRNLIVWQKAMEVAKDTYAIARQFPKEEQFGLANQMRRCAVSIPSNIAEGAKRASKKEFAQFLRIAAGSAAELETQLLLAHEIYSADISHISLVLNEVQRMIEVLGRKL